MLYAFCFVFKYFFGTLLAIQDMRFLAVSVSYLALFILLYVIQNIMVSGLHFESFLISFLLVPLYFKKEMGLGDKLFLGAISPFMPPWDLILFWIASGCIGMFFGTMLIRKHTQKIPFITCLVLAIFMIDWLQILFQYE